MFITYLENPAASFHGDRPLDILKTWARDHKTMIVLNGGADEEMWKVHSFLLDNAPDLPYPFERFREPGIGGPGAGALTCVGVVLNEHMVEGVQAAREHRTDECPIYVNDAGTTVIKPETPLSFVAGDNDGKSVKTTDFDNWNLTPKYTKVEWQLAQILGSKPLA
jgi:hypothetical protein